MWEQRVQNAYDSTAINLKSVLGTSYEAFHKVVAFQQVNPIHHKERTVFKDMKDFKQYANLPEDKVDTNNLRNSFISPCIPIKLQTTKYITRISSFSIKK